MSSHSALLCVNEGFTFLFFLIKEKRLNELLDVRLFENSVLSQNNSKTLSR